MKILLDLQSVDEYVDCLVAALMQQINPKKDDVIFVSSNIIDETTNSGIFKHSIYVCPLIQLCRTHYWDDCEIFMDKDDSLYLYLKGRMLIQTTTTWTVFTGKILAKHYKIECNYSLETGVKP